MCKYDFLITINVTVCIIGHGLVVVSIANYVPSPRRTPVLGGRGDRRASKVILIEISSQQSYLNSIHTPWRYLGLFGHNARCCRRQTDRHGDRNTD